MSAVASFAGGTAWSRCSRAERMQQPGWYLQRLRVMSGAEVAHRLARKVRTAVAEVHFARIAAAR